MFFLFPKSAGNCDVATRVGGAISRCPDVLVSVCEPIVTVEAEGMAKMEVDDEGGGLMMWRLVWAFVATLDIVGNDAGVSEGLCGENSCF